MTIRLSPEQELVLTELGDKLKTNKSVLVRAIIGDWLHKNEEYVNRTIERNTENDENNTTGETALFD